eukprot:SAG22_NODE_5577_length_990_cov_2.491582_1_plen_23_part_10
MGARARRDGGLETGYIAVLVNI